MRRLFIVPLAAVMLSACGSDDTPPRQQPTVTQKVVAPSDTVVAYGTGEKLAVNVGTETTAAKQSRIVTRLAFFGPQDAVNVRYVPGTWQLPAGVPGQVEGLSWDGSRAVVVSTEDTGRFTTLDMRDRKARPREVQPTGRYTYDGISTDGNRLFLNQRADAQGEPHYRVLRYDLRRGVLDPRPIVDKAESEPFLVGRPVARAANRDFLYTVYENSEHPFVHALQANGDYALCLDLPAHPQRPDAAVAWTMTRDGDGAALLRNAVLKTSYRLTRGELRPVE